MSLGATMMWCLNSGYSRLQKKLEFEVNHTYEMSVRALPWVDLSIPNANGTGTIAERG
jgi:hypothetical protein